MCTDIVLVLSVGNRCRVRDVEIVFSVSEIKQAVCSGQVNRPEDVLVAFTLLKTQIILPDVGRAYHLQPQVMRPFFLRHAMLYPRMPVECLSIGLLTMNRSPLQATAVGLLAIEKGNISLGRSCAFQSLPEKTVFNPVIRIQKNHPFTPVYCQSGISCSIYTLIFLMNKNQPLVGDGTQYGRRFVGRAIIHNNHLNAECLLAVEPMYLMADSGLRIEYRDNDADINFRLHIRLRFPFAVIFLTRDGEDVFLPDFLLSIK